MNPDTCHLMRKSSLTAWFLVLQSNMCLEPRTAVVPERLPSKADHRIFFFFGGTCLVRHPCGLKISNIHHLKWKSKVFLWCLTKGYNTEKKIIVPSDTTLSSQNSTVASFSGHRQTSTVYQLCSDWQPIDRNPAWLPFACFNSTDNIYPLPGSYFEKPFVQTVMSKYQFKKLSVSKLSENKKNNNMPDTANKVWYNLGTESMMIP